MRRAACGVGVVLSLVGCPASPPPPPPVVATPAAAAASTAHVGSREAAASSPTELVSLDAVDGLELPEELAHMIAKARANVPASPTPEQRTKLEDLESKYERLEAAALEEDDGEEATAANSAKAADVIARVLAGYYWERLRLFTPELPAEAPEELVTAFARSGVRRK